MADEEIDVGAPVDVDMDDDPAVKRRGRGFSPTSGGPAQDGVKHTGGKFDLIVDGGQAGSSGQESQESAAKSVEGWIIIATNIDEEATEEEVVDKFADFGPVQTCHLNLDRRTGYVKGYALLEYEKFEDAQSAIEACTGGDLTLMDKPLKADFAFVKPPAHAGGGNAAAASGRRGAPGANRRNRSRSPVRR